MEETTLSLARTDEWVGVTVLGMERVECWSRVSPSRLWMLVACLAAAAAAVPRWMWYPSPTSSFRFCIALLRLACFSSSARYEYLHGQVGKNRKSN